MASVQVIITVSVTGNSFKAAATKSMAPAYVAHRTSGRKPTKAENRSAYLQTGFHFSIFFHKPRRFDQCALAQAFCVATVVLSTHRGSWAHTSTTSTSVRLCTAGIIEAKRPAASSGVGHPFLELCMCFVAPDSKAICRKESVCGHSSPDPSQALAM